MLQSIVMAFCKNESIGEICWQVCWGIWFAKPWEGIEYPILRHVNFFHKILNRGCFSFLSPNGFQQAAMAAPGLINGCGRWPSPCSSRRCQSKPYCHGELRDGWCWIFIDLPSKQTHKPTTPTISISKTYLHLYIIIYLWSYDFFVYFSTAGMCYGILMYSGSESQILGLCSKGGAAFRNIDATGGSRPWPTRRCWKQATYSGLETSHGSPTFQYLLVWCDDNDHHFRELEVSFCGVVTVLDWFSGKWRGNHAFFSWDMGESGDICRQIHWNLLVDQLVEFPEFVDDWIGQARTDLETTNEMLMRFRCFGWRVYFQFTHWTHYSSLLYTFSLHRFYGDVLWCLPVSPGSPIKGGRLVSEISLEEAATDDHVASYTALSKRGKWGLGTSWNRRRCWPQMLAIGLLVTLGQLGISDGNFPHRFSQINDTQYSIHFCWTSWSLSQLQMFTAKILRSQPLFEDVLSSWDQVREVDVWAWAKTETAQTFG